MRGIIDTKTLIIQLLGCKKDISISADEILDFMQYLYKSLFDVKKLDQYCIAYDINIYSLINIVEYNDDIFYMNIFKRDNDIQLIDNEIMVKNSKILEQCIQKYNVDDTILGIVRKYCYEIEIKRTINDTSLSNYQKIITLPK